MAKEVKITMSDLEFEALQEAYAKYDIDVEKADVNEAYVKTRWMNFLKAKIRNYDEKVQEVTYSTFDPS